MFREAAGPPAPPLFACPVPQGSQAPGTGAVMERKTDDYVDHPPEDTLNTLDTDPDQGLSEAEAARRLERFGPNEIQERDLP